MTLKEMRQVLEARGIRLTKSLGQNFLHDAHHLQKIVAAAQLDAADRVVEIGAGLGPLTMCLKGQVAELVAVEKDERLIRVLEEQFGVTAVPGLSSTDSDTPTKRDSSCLQLVHADALLLLRDHTRDWSGWKVVSNLPYSVASPILVELCQGPRSPRLVVVTLQWEVAERLMCAPGSKDYGVLTLLVQLDFEPVGSFRIAAGCFFPKPEVDSACLVLKRRNSAALPSALRPTYQRIVKRAFSQRRKMMFKLLKQDWTKERLGAAYEHLGLSEQVRAESVSREEFIELTRSLAG